MNEIERDQELCRDMAILKQLYERLVSISPLSAVRKLLQNNEAKKKAAEDLLLRIHILCDQVRRRLRSSSGSGFPVVSLPDDLRRFYADVLEPNFDLLNSLYLDSFFADVDISEIMPTPVAGATSLLFENQVEPRKRKMLDQALDVLKFKTETSPEDYSWIPEEFEELANLMATSFFSPDKWQENMDELRPIVSSRLPRDFPAHVRYRLTELYHSFFFGNWMSVHALARSLIEYAMIERGLEFGVEVNENTKKGHRPKRLSDLIKAYKDSAPEIIGPLESIKVLGDETLHPRKDAGVVHFPQSMRSKALECVIQSRQVVEYLYR